MSYSYPQMIFNDYTPQHGEYIPSSTQLIITTFLYQVSYNIYHPTMMYTLCD